MGHGRLNSPRFEFIEDGFGAVAHELGHALGLPHDTRKDDRDLMGNGFRKLRYNYLTRFAEKPSVGFSVENARFLRWSRFLSERNDWTDQEHPKVTVAFPEKLAAGATNITFTVEISDNEALGAALYFSSAQDSVVGGIELEGRSMKRTETVAVKELKPGEFKFKVLVIDRSGNQAERRITALCE